MFACMMYLNCQYTIYVSATGRQYSSNGDINDDQTSIFHTVLSTLNIEKIGRSPLRA